MVQLMAAWQIITFQFSGKCLDPFLWTSYCGILCDCGRRPWEEKQMMIRNGFADIKIAALFIHIIADLSPTSCSRKFHLKLNSLRYDILIGTLFPLIEQIRKSLLGKGNLWERWFRIHNLELKICFLALFVWQPVCSSAQRQRRRLRSQWNSGLTLPLLSD